MRHKLLKIASSCMAFVLIATVITTKVKADSSIAGVVDFTKANSVEVGHNTLENDRNENGVDTYLLFKFKAPESAKYTFTVSNLTKSGSSTNDSDAYGAFSVCYVIKEGSIDTLLPFNMIVDGKMDYTTTQPYSYRLAKGQVVYLDIAIGQDSNIDLDIAKSKLPESQTKYTAMTTSYKKAPSVKVGKTNLKIPAKDTVVYSKFKATKAGTYKFTFTDLRFFGMSSEDYNCFNMFNVGKLTSKGIDKQKVKVNGQATYDLMLQSKGVIMDGYTKDSEDVTGYNTKRSFSLKLKKNETIYLIGGGFIEEAITLDISRE